MLSEMVRIETWYGVEMAEGYKTETPGLVVTRKPTSSPTGYTTWFTITHEASGFCLSYRLAGKKDEVMAIANRLSGPDWTKPSPLIYQNPKPYQDAIKAVLEVDEKQAE